ncbi:BURP domain protein RD22 [Trifolium repens]|nr:BURP domain protein RD22 [Trifolium repens]
MLPNTSMPKAITNLLQPAEYWNKEKAAWMVKLYDEKFVVPPIPLIYIYAASETQLHDKSNAALFFLEKDLHHGTKLNYQFTNNTSNYEAKFLPREVANSIPFSSNKLENILDKFSIKKGSKEAEILKHTISECEEKSIKGERKLCVTSLESMVDFTTSKLGNNVEVIATEVEKESSELKEYVIEKGVKKLGDKNKTIVCHKENYPYAVFYCHKTDSSEAYYVPLEDVDGNRVKAIVVCHTDTSNWNPKVLAFQMLKVQPGTVPICHFVPQDHVVWISK